MIKVTIEWKVSNKGNKLNPPCPKVVKYCFIGIITYRLFLSFTMEGTMRVSLLPEKKSKLYGIIFMA